MKKIIITDYVNNPTIESEIFGDKIKIICLNEEDESNFSDEIMEAEAILVWHAKITEKTLKRLKNCKIIVKYGTGYDNIDYKACAEYKIPFCNTPDYGVEEVSDTACAFILGFIRQIYFYNDKSKYIRNGWQCHSEIPIKRTSDHCLGIIGMGRMGTTVALRMKSFGMQVGFYDPFVSSGYEKAIGVKRFNNLNDLIKFSSIISIHTPLTSTTKGMIDDDFIDQLNSGTILVNTARGKIIKNLDVLMRGLMLNKISFLGLDVIPDEPPSNFEQLIQEWKNTESIYYNRILINPHSAYYSIKSWHEMRSKCADNVNNVINGGQPINLIS
jgi:lactate dehydrogenase-like 2-hydroxyacid dehydrogenase